MLTVDVGKTDFLGAFFPQNGDPTGEQLGVDGTYLLSAGLRFMAWAGG